MNSSLNFSAQDIVLPEDYDSPASSGSASKRKSGRRSWFTPNKQVITIRAVPFEKLWPLKIPRGGGLKIFAILEGGGPENFAILWVGGLFLLFVTGNQQKM